VEAASFDPRPTEYGAAAGVDYGFQAFAGSYSSSASATTTAAQFGGQSFTETMSGFAVAFPSAGSSFATTGDYTSAPAPAVTAHPHHLMAAMSSTLPLAYSTPQLEPILPASATAPASSADQEEAGEDWTSFASQPTSAAPPADLSVPLSGLSLGPSPLSPSSFSSTSLPKTAQDSSQFGSFAAFADGGSNGSFAAKPKAERAGNNARPGQVDWQEQSLRQCLVHLQQGSSPPPDYDCSLVTPH
jgi:hypothetical protein